MTNETTHGKELARADEAPKAVVAWDNRGPSPQTVEDTYRIAKVFLAAGICRNTLKCIEHYMVVIWAGQAIGVPPVQAVQGIMLVNDRPCVWGDLGMALAQRSGLLEAFAEAFEGDGDDLVAVCTMQRRGLQPKTSRFSMQDARTAGLAGKDTYRKFPRRMLMWRARYYLLRDLFADVLGGMDIREIVAEQPFDPARAPGVSGVAQRLLAAAPEPLVMDLRHGESAPVAAAPAPADGESTTGVACAVSPRPEAGQPAEQAGAIEQPPPPPAFDDPTGQTELVPRVLRRPSTPRQTATRPGKPQAIGREKPTPPVAAAPGPSAPASVQAAYLLDAAPPPPDLPRAARAAAKRCRGALLPSAAALRLAQIALERFGGDETRAEIELLDPDTDWSAAVDRVIHEARTPATAPVA